MFIPMDVPTLPLFAPIMLAALVAMFPDESEGFNIFPLIGSRLAHFT